MLGPLKVWGSQHHVTDLCETGAQANPALWSSRRSAATASLGQRPKRTGAGCAAGTARPAAWSRATSATPGGQVSARSSLCVTDILLPRTPSQRSRALPAFHMEGLVGHREGDWDSVSQILQGRERRLIHSDSGVQSVRQAACVRIQAAPSSLVATGH